MLISELALYNPAPLSIKPITYFNEQTLPQAKGTQMLFDAEVLPNFFFVAFKCYNTGRVLTFERSPATDFNPARLKWVLANCCVIGFNSVNFDMPILWAAIYGKTTQELKAISDEIINSGKKGGRPMLPWHAEKQYGFKMGFSNHIDLYRVAPSSPTQGQMESSDLKFAGLKQYGARLHAPTIQDLPVDHDKPISAEQADIVRRYCVNDLDQTGILYHELREAIKLREEIGMRYELELRSKSDAQIAEVVIANEIQDRQGKKPKSPGLPKEQIKFRCPKYVQFYTPQLRGLLFKLLTTPFEYKWYPDKHKHKLEPIGGVRNHTVTIDGRDYSVGMGGLHSCEKQQFVEISGDDMIIDRDVASFYPSMVLNQGWYPEHVGEDFLTVYRELYEKRLRAKAAKRKVESDSLKIVINGTFGKTGNRHSCIFSPWMMISITLTGQLSLLMLIEMLSMVGIKTISANTDGVIVHINKSQYDLYLAVCQDWMRITGYDTDETRYRLLAMRDVNNYIGIETDGKIKAKGTYVCPYMLKPGAREFMTSNPHADICTEAAMRYLATHQTAKPEQVEATIRNCKDVRRFIVVRKVKGGAVKNGHYLGRVVRWYYRENEFGEINYAGSGNLVPQSGGGFPIMEMPATLPTDIDYNWYVKEAFRILRDIGFYGGKEEQGSLF